MNIFRRFMMLKFWNKLAAIGALASIIGLIYFLLPKSPTVIVKTENQQGGITANEVLVDTLSIKTENSVNEKSSAIQQMANSPGGVQIGSVDGSVTVNQGLLTSNGDEVTARLRSEVIKLLRFPDAIPDESNPPSLLERMLVNKSPRRLFDLLMRYEEKDIPRVPGIGSLLHDHLTQYYQFRETTLQFEKDLMLRIGQMVRVRFKAGWMIYLRYVLMRFGGRSKESIIAGGDFLNYDITWDDTERVFTELSNDKSVSREISELFALHQSLISAVNRLTDECSGSPNNGDR